MSRIDDIERRAYELWEQEGKPEGAHMDHWRRAKEEMDGIAPQTGDVGGMLGGQTAAHPDDTAPLAGSVTPRDA